jgi:NDP-sugar pyrophosphorylase family protein
MLLAAGKGERLRPLTDALPKPMVELCGTPLLEYQIRLLCRHGFTEICINLHHLPRIVTEYFGDGQRFGVNIHYSLEPELLGTAGAVKKVESFFDGPFLVLYGDNLTDCDLTSLVDYHKQKGGIGTIVCVWKKEVQESGILDFDAQPNRISRFVEKPKIDQVFSQWINAGVYVLELRVLDHIPIGIPFDFGKDLFPLLLSKGESLFAFPLNCYLRGIDRLESKLSAESDIADGRFRPQ